MQTITITNEDGTSETFVGMITEFEHTVSFDTHYDDFGMGTLCCGDGIGVVNISMRYVNGPRDDVPSEAVA